MKIKFLDAVSFVDASYAPGEIGDIENAEAERLINAGLAEKVSPVKKQKTEE